ncbi:hypothetical protein [Shinella sp. BYT-45]|uniref:hypothetical protein n=1 Tax=Shinella sp. BYT-45 TaxID=3377377 RepID=UPI00398015EA
MRNEPPSGIDELHAIVDQKLTTLVRELEEAGWNAEDIAFAIDGVLRRKWLDQAEALRRTRAAVPEDFVSDGNEG